MGILIGCEDIGFEWPGRQVLEGQTLSVNEGERIGIVGQNGDGKTTLLELLAKRIEPDEGRVTWRNNIQVGVLAQDDSLDDAQTVAHEVVGDVPEYTWASDANVRAILHELLADVDWNGTVGALSGGQRRRVDLARLLVGTWDVLLLDEPTNHLDLHAITWLAGHLKRRWPHGTGALLVVTHDRWFLDEVCEHMWEVHDRVVEPFDGGYSAYVQQRVERERQAAVAEVRRQNVLRKELNWLAHGAKARTSKPKFRIEAARALLADDPPLRNPVELRRAAMSRLGKQVIEMEGVAAGYVGTDVIDDVTWIVGPGDRVGILGENGVGKSTLLRVMTGRQEPTRGTVKIGKTVRFGYMSQHLDVLEDRLDWRVSELLGRYKASYMVGGKQQTPTQLLEGLGFDRKQLQTFVGDLSGGQRRRLAILCVLMEEPNVLVLDEPGNDLDTQMLAVLEDLLDTWPGTLIMVSHDRYLMERVTDNQYALIDGHVRHVPGGVDEYLRLLDERERDMDEKDGSAATDADASVDGGEGTGSSRRLSNTERRDAKRRLDSVTRRLERLSSEPDAIRERMAALDQSDFQALMDAQAELRDAEEKIAALEDEWLELSELLGEE